MGRGFAYVGAHRLTAMATTAVGVGIVLRLAWPSDMEYKADETYAYVHSLTRALPSIGQGASVGIPNPALGQWLFWLIAHLERAVTGTVSPVSMVRGVMLINGLTLIALLAFALTAVPHQERRPWLWATALISLNPVAILFSRKLWIECMIAPFTLAAIWGWWYRDSRKGAFAWGLLAACLGQVHMAGFFLAAAFAAWTALFDRTSTRWRWWLAGSVVGCLTVIPWIIHVAGAPSSSSYDLRNLVPSQFWYYWVVVPLGLPIYESFGSDQGQLLAWPTLNGAHLHLMWLATAITAVAGVGVYVLAVKTVVRARRQGHSLRRLLARTDTARLIAIGSLGVGALLSADGTPVYRQYLTAVFALPCLMLAFGALRAGRAGRWLLTGLVLSQAVMSAGYLTYVHARGGSPASDYGYTYAQQLKRAYAREHLPRQSAVAEGGFSEKSRHESAIGPTSSATSRSSNHSPGP
jgi:4-amino-4-deoxy-L-arabinose transferase-like glycosyltransferase